MWTPLPLRVLGTGGELDPRSRDVYRSIAYRSGCLLGRPSARQQGDELLQLQIAGFPHIDELSHLYLNPGFNCRSDIQATVFSCCHLRY